MILVMDRGNEDLKLITSLLQKTGFHVVQSANKEDIINLCRSANHSVQLVIIDTATPHMHISDLLNQVQGVDPRIRVLLISPQKETEPAEQLSAASNVRAHLSRPFRRARFIGSVLEVTKEPLVRTA